MCVLCREAAITVILGNGGDLAYRPDFYGDEIIVTRSIKRNMGSTFKISGSLSTKNVSKSKDELVAICDAFNIKVDNPLVVLSQDHAKKFLIHTTPSATYEVCTGRVFFVVFRKGHAIGTVGNRLCLFPRKAIRHAKDTLAGQRKLAQNCRTNSSTRKDPP